MFWLIGKNQDSTQLTDILLELQSLGGQMGTQHQGLLTSLSQIGVQLGNIKIDMPRFRSTKFSEIPLAVGVPTLIVEPENSSRRTTINNLGPATILILHGVANPTIEDLLKSPWSLDRGATGQDELDGGYPVWAMAIAEDAVVRVGTEYPEATTTNTTMEIKTAIGTGLNWDNSLVNGNNWHNNLLDVNSTATGYKLFYFSNFTPGQSYDFSVIPGALSYDTLAPLPINFYLLKLDGTLKSLFWRLTAGLNSLDPLKQMRDMLAIAKNSSWAAGLSSAGGTFSLTPDSGRYLGCCDVRVTGELYAQTAVINFAPNAENTGGTFTIEGY